jgi:hypothetical protein
VKCQKIKIMNDEKQFLVRLIQNLAAKERDTKIEEEEEELALDREEEENYAFFISQINENRERRQEEEKKEIERKEKEERERKAKEEKEEKERKKKEQEEEEKKKAEEKAAQDKKILEERIAEYEKLIKLPYEDKKVEKEALLYKEETWQDKNKVNQILQEIYSPYDIFIYKQIFSQKIPKQILFDDIPDKIEPLHIPVLMYFSQKILNICFLEMKLTPYENLPLILKYGKIYEDACRILQIESKKDEMFASYFCLIAMHCCRNIDNVNFFSDLYWILDNVKDKCLKFRFLNYMLYFTNKKSDNTDQQQILKNLLRDVFKKDTSFVLFHVKKLNEIVSFLSKNVCVPSGECFNLNTALITRGAKPEYEEDMQTLKAIYTFLSVIYGDREFMKTNIAEENLRVWGALFLRPLKLNVTLEGVPAASSQSFLSLWQNNEHDFVNLIEINNDKESHFWDTDNIWNFNESKKSFFIKGQIGFENVEKFEMEIIHDMSTFLDLHNQKNVECFIKILEKPKNIYNESCLLDFLKNICNLDNPSLNLKFTDISQSLYDSPLDSWVLDAKDFMQNVEDEIKTSSTVSFLPEDKTLEDKQPLEKTCAILSQVYKNLKEKLDLQNLNRIYSYLCIDALKSAFSDFTEYQNYFEDLHLGKHIFFYILQDVAKENLLEWQKDILPRKEDEDKDEEKYGDKFIANFHLAYFINPLYIHKYFQNRIKLDDIDTVTSDNFINAHSSKITFNVKPRSFHIIIDISLEAKGNDSVYKDLDFMLNVQNHVNFQMPLKKETQLENYKAISERYFTKAKKIFDNNVFEEDFDILCQKSYMCNSVFYDQEMKKVDSKEKWFSILEKNAKKAEINIHLQKIFSEELFIYDALIYASFVASQNNVTAELSKIIQNLEKNSHVDPFHVQYIIHKLQKRIIEENYNEYKEKIEKNLPQEKKQEFIKDIKESEETGKALIVDKISQDSKSLCDILKCDVHPDVTLFLKNLLFETENEILQNVNAEYTEILKKYKNDKNALDIDAFVQKAAKRTWQKTLQDEKAFQLKISENLLSRKVERMPFPPMILQDFLRLRESLVDVIFNKTKQIFGDNSPILTNIKKALYNLLIDTKNESLKTVKQNVDSICKIIDCKEKSRCDRVKNFTKDWLQEVFDKKDVFDYEKIGEELYEKHLKPYETQDLSELKNYAKVVTYKAWLLVLSDQTEALDKSKVWFS